MTDTAATLTDLLGDTRAEIVDRLRTQPRSVAELAEVMGISEVAIRRHLSVLERDDLVVSETVHRKARGRPGMRYGLSDRGHRLFPDRSAELATELMGYLEDEHGRAALLGFLRWRQGRQEQRYETALAGAPDDLTAQAERLAELLSEDGFLAEVTKTVAPDGGTVLELRQSHCAIKDVARDHPEVCAYEAALFRRLLGTRISRRQTIAAGARECVCHIPTCNSDTDTGARHGDQS